MFISSRIADSFEASFFSVNTTENFITPDYVFLLIQKGAITVLQEETKSVLQENDIILLHPDIQYSFQYLSRNQVFMFRIKRSFFDNNIPVERTICVNSSENNKDRYQPLVHKLQDIGILYSDKAHQFAFISELYALLDLILTHYTVSETAEMIPDSSSPSDLRVEKIRQYINQHYHLPIFLQTLADEMFLSPQYLSKFIKQHMGITFNKYLNNVRLSHAYDELTHTNHSITEIAFNNGFSNTSAFNKQFRDAYQISPTTYRKQHGIESAPDHPIHVDTFQSDNGSRSVELAQLDVSYANYSPYYPSWSDTINIGTLSNALTESFQTTFAEAQKQLHFKYVRFNNIFDDVMISVNSSGGGYNFDNLDMIFDFFREIHVIPFIEICYKPPKISITSQTFSREIQEDLFAPEKESNYLASTLSAMLKHFLNRYSRAELSQWRFEIWAKHDEILTYLETPKEYWDKYKLYYDVIKSIVPECAVGGPGFNTSAGLELFQNLMQEMQNRQIRPDFFSIYIYCYATAEYTLKRENQDPLVFKNLSTDPDYPLHTFQIYQEKLAGYAPSDIPLYVTEFNSGLNGYNHVAASAFQAAFICKNMLALFQKTPCIAYWHFSDISSEIYLNPQTYAAGMGLLEQHGIPKPGYFSLSFFARLKSQLAVNGRQYIATTNGRNKFQFMIMHYAHYNNNYCFTYQNRLGIGNTYTIFEEPGNRKLTVNLNDLPSGRYKCLTYILNRRHGSILDRYIDILNQEKTTPAELEYMIMNMQSEEINYFRSVAIPKTEILYRETTTGTLDFELNLEPHEVLLISLERKTS